MKKLSKTKDIYGDIPDNITEIFGETLRTLRSKKSISQNGLAKTSGLSGRMISDIERGLKQPSLITLMKLANGLKVSLAYFIAKSGHIDHPIPI